MLTKLERVSVYYYPARCETCGGYSDWGRLIAIPSKEASAKNGFKFVCPDCYKTIARGVEIPTCLRDPERLDELLERYKEV
jgi:hypothetical protein